MKGQGDWKKISRRLHLSLDYRSFKESKGINWTEYERGECSLVSLYNEHIHTLDKIESRLKRKHTSLNQSTFSFSLSHKTPKTEIKRKTKIGKKVKEFSSFFWSFFFLPLPYAKNKYK